MIIVFKLLMISLVALLAPEFVVDCQTRMQRSEQECGENKTFDPSKVDESITKEFLKAWNRAHNGIGNTEAGISIFQNVEGSYWAIAMPYTNESGQITFIVDPAPIAIVHTHQNGLDPKPSAADIRVADKYCVPIFTITSWGMYMYDPKTKKITLIQHNLDWLRASKFKRNP